MKRNEFEEISIKHLVTGFNTVRVQERGISMRTCLSLGSNHVSNCAFLIIFLLGHKFYSGLLYIGVFGRVFSFRSIL